MPLDDYVGYASLHGEKRALFVHLLWAIRLEQRLLEKPAPAKEQDRRRRRCQEGPDVAACAV
ncbi:MAG: hypothetical protein LQ341_000578 [Variospora aurantia]|nr:MAG: hypothetical protein LQ341_000578 [Variospora aurantia]